jgi:hypothetical protein
MFYQFTVYAPEQALPIAKLGSVASKKQKMR